MENGKLKVLNLRKNFDLIGFDSILSLQYDNIYGRTVLDNCMYRNIDYQCLKYD